MKDKVADLNMKKAVVRNDMVLMKVYEKETKIILQGTKPETTFLYAEIVVVGGLVTDIKPGYIVTSISPKAPVTEFPLKDGKYYLTQRHNCELAFAPEDVNIEELKK